MRKWESLPETESAEIPPVRGSQRLYLLGLRDLVSATPRADESWTPSFLGQGVDRRPFNDPGMPFDVLQPGTRVDASVFDESLGGVRQGLQGQTRLSCRR